VNEPTLPAAVYRYWACDLRTGNKIAQLPLAPSGPLPERICDVSTAQFTCDHAAVLADGGDFIGSVTPGRTVIVVEREYEGDSVSDILWAGIVTVVQVGSSPQARLNCATIPYYLTRRYVGTHTYLAGPGDTDGQIITDLLGDAAAEGIGLVLDVNCPTVRAVRYRSIDHKTVLQALNELSALDGGPEWTVSTRWVDATRTSVDFVFVARTRLGWAGDPNARFDFPGCINEYTIDYDYSEGHGANHIVGVNPAGAESVPARDEQGITSQGWARWQQGIATSGDLNAAGLAGVAREALAHRARGQVTNELKVSMSRGPQYGRDVSLGDNVLWFVEQPAPGTQPASPAHPNGHQEVIRMIGIDLDIPGDTYTPALWSPYAEEATN